MSAYTFGTNSAARLSTGHVDLGIILRTGLSRSRIDFGISQVARPFEEQLKYFLNGDSKLDPRVPEMLASAMHVVTDERPMAMAADIYAYHPDKEIRTALAYDKASLAYIAGILVSTSISLFQSKRASHVLRWGGNWDRDGVIIQDQTFQDLPHFELVKP